MSTALDFRGLMCRWCPHPATGYVHCWDETGTVDDPIGVCADHRAEVTRCGYVVVALPT